MLKKVLETYLRQYRPFFIFLLRFFLVYVVLTVIYQYYLDTNRPNGNTDGITQSVAMQTGLILESLGYDALMKQHPDQPSMMLILEDVYVARVVEGCNAVSVAILFMAFVVAFKGKMGRTIVFVFAGCVMIHILNILRIALLSIALLRYPDYEHILHGVIFPLFIYGVVFSLWVIWVNKFSLHASKNATV